MEPRFRNGSHYGNSVDITRFGVRQIEATRDGTVRQFGLVGTLLLPRELGLLDGGNQFSVLEQSAGGPAEQSAHSQNDHFFLPAPSRCSILAKLSRRATVRLNTMRSSVESGSTQK